MWLPQGGALKIENLQLTQYSIIQYYNAFLFLIMLNISHCSELQLTIIVTERKFGQS